MSWCQNSRRSSPAPPTGKGFQASDTIYVDSIVGSSTDVFNGATCNARVTSGCGQTPVSVPMGGWPSNVTVNPTTGTVYAPDNVDGQVSFLGNPAP